MRTFRLFRIEDVSGVSGTGHIAEGVVFTDGVCVLNWTTQHKSTAIYQSLETLEAIHGHEGRTKIMWST